ncbi:hypothetical protein K474DRAFT_1707754 [Panus rudis PR-1116 ss-1]|nr:hypothetical protein K474DRAFT_1707754 [Panus rudis PR-1116 ss-1]
MSLGKRPRTDDKGNTSPEPAGESSRKRPRIDDELQDAVDSTQSQQPEPSEPPTTFLEITPDSKETANFTDSFLDQCSPSTLARLAREPASRDDSGLKNYMARRYDINEKLSRFFEDPITFRSLQAATSTLISGSTALQFFDRSFYPGSDLDLFTEFKYSEQLGKWLMDEAGYVFEPTDRSPDFDRAWRYANNKTVDPIYPTDAGVAAVFTFTKPSANDGDAPLKVQVVTCEKRKQPIDVITQFHSTVVMNAITHNEAFCFWPLATLEHRQAAINPTRIPKQPKPNNPAEARRLAAIEKYRQRGWEMLSPSNLKDLKRRPDYKSVFGRRSASIYQVDSRVWVISLDTTGVDPEPFYPEYDGSGSETEEVVEEDEYGAYYDYGYDTY